MMWGEIDPPVKTQPSLFETEDESRIADEAVARTRRCVSSFTVTQRRVQDAQVNPSAASV